jgi:type IV secretory pathway VirB2 component (pilin)
MKKFTKILLKMLPIFLVVVVLLAPVVSAATSTDTGIAPTMPSAGTGITNIDNAAKNVWGTIQTVVQIVAIAAVIIAGVRYMLAGPNDKADIKKQTVALVFGAILVFAAVPVINFIIGIFNQVTA